MDFGRTFLGGEDPSLNPVPLFDLKLDFVEGGFGCQQEVQLLPLRALGCEGYRQDFEIALTRSRRDGHNRALDGNERGADPAVRAGSSLSQASDADREEV